MLELIAEANGMRLRGVRAGVQDWDTGRRQRRHPPGLITALLACAIMSAAGATVPTTVMAGTTSLWAPDPAALVQATRACPSPPIASYDDATCWTVPLDQSNPLYSAGDPYPWGQCTYWVLELRPDLWNNRSASDPDPDNWAAYTWAAHASLEGLTVDEVPAPGAVIVWPQTSDDPTGHVAYVQGVGIDPSSGNDLITVQEFNNQTFDDPSQGQGDTMTLHMSIASLAGVQFVHQPGYVAPSARVPPPSPTLPVPTSAATRVSSRTASVPAAHRNPRLRLLITRTGLEALSDSPGRLEATIRKLPVGKMVKRIHLRSDARSQLHLHRGRYRYCVSQLASGPWRRAIVCALAGR